MANQQQQFIGIPRSIKNDLIRLRYQCTAKSTILPANFSYWYSQVHLIKFCWLQNVQRKRFRPGKVIHWRKNDFMNKLSLIGSCQQVVRLLMKVSLTSKPSDCFKILTAKNYSTANRGFFIFPKYTLTCFLNSFESQPLPSERSSPSRFPVFTKYIPVFYGAMSL